MGALHAGHATLIRRAAAQSDLVCVSVFVNPTQFNDPKDLARYPRSPDSDLSVCESEGAGVVFLPTPEEMLPQGTPQLTMAIPELTRTMCGPGRPGHFEGVLHVVARLLHVFAPDAAYFGKKDYQQFTIIRRMVSELMFPVEIVGCETVREPDGLAMSSRNQLLTPRAREHALLIHRALRMAEQNYAERQTRPDELAEIVADIISSGTENEVEYVQIVHPDTLAKLSVIGGDLRSFVIAVAIRSGGIRLIDNAEVVIQ